MTTQVCGVSISALKKISQPKIRNKLNLEDGENDYYEQKLTEVTETLKKLPQKFLESKKLQKCVILPTFFKLVVPLQSNRSSGIRNY